MFILFPEAMLNSKRYLSYISPRSIFQPGTQVTYISVNDVGVWQAFKNSVKSIECKHSVTQIAYQVSLNVVSALKSD